MSNSNESSARIAAALITAIAMVIVAFIGFYGIKVQTETPIYATLTALPPTIIVKQTLVVVTMNSPRLTVNNKLKLPVKISIDGQVAGDVTAQSSKVFLLESYPAKVRWEVIKVTTSNGTVLGHDMSGTFEKVYDNGSIIIDNVVADQEYFYPILTNNTDKNCSIAINESWNSEFVTDAYVNAYTKNVRVGYFKLFSNSNVVLNCDGKLHWWGLRSGETKGTAFSEKVEKDTGVIYFTLNP